MRTSEQSVDFERLARLSPGLLAVLRPDATFEWANDALTSRLERPGLVDASLLDFLHPEDVDRTRAALAELPRERALAPYALRIRVGSSEDRWLEGHLRRDTDGRIFAGFRDVTLARAEHAAVLRKRELLHLAEELADIGHWRYDHAKGSLEWSPGV